MQSGDWFAVSRDGLRKLTEGRPKLFVIAELLSNAWDETSTRVAVTLEGSDRRGRSVLTVTDDNPEGFADLTHAYTLYADSSKKGEAEKRGRFNLGEKLVLSLCDWATITTTTGTVKFNEDGSRSAGRSKTAAGSEFKAVIRITQAERAEIEESIAMLIPPSGITTTFNGDELHTRTKVASFMAALPTVAPDVEGIMRNTRRMCVVDLFEPRAGEVATIYELGIPVVETGDRYHANVMQKVPLNKDRDNVPPAFLRQLRTETLNATFTRIKGDEAKQTWVSEALADDAVKQDAVRSVVTSRFGENAVVYSPSDPEANAKAAASGFTVVHGGSFSRDAWDNIKAADALPAATVQFATPTVLTGGPGDPIVQTIPVERYTRGMHYVVELTNTLSQHLIRRSIAVGIVMSPERFSACYERTQGKLLFNVSNLTKEWFDPDEGDDIGCTDHIEHVVDLIVHELAHHFESNHLSENYYHALSAMAGKVCALALANPSVFRPIRSATDMDSLVGSTGR